jgi:hypothetical protein
MNTRSSIEYRYIFTTTWNQASTSHLSSWLTDNASGKLLIIFILSYLFLLSTSFLRIPKTHNRTSFQVWNANILHFCSFCKPKFSGATREWDALYLVKGTNYAVGHYAAISNLQSLQLPSVQISPSASCCQAPSSFHIPLRVLRDLLETYYVSQVGGM